MQYLRYRLCHVSNLQHLRLWMKLDQRMTRRGRCRLRMSGQRHRHHQLHSMRESQLSRKRIRNHQFHHGCLLQNQIPPILHHRLRRRSSYRFGCRCHHHFLRMFARQCWYWFCLKAGRLSQYLHHHRIHLACSNLHRLLE